MSKRLSLLAVILLTVPSLLAQRVEPKFFRDAIGQKSYPHAPQIARQSAAEPLMTLADSAVVVPEEIDAIHAWNAAGKEPMSNGFTRRLPGGIAVRISPQMYKAFGTISTGGAALVATNRGTMVWSGSVRVENAHRLRLHLTGVSVPPGSTFWVYGRTGDPIPFDSDLVDPTGGLYAPAVDGDLVYLEFETPAASEAAAAFTLSDVVEIVRPYASTASEQKFRTQPSDSPSCLIDATCVTSATLDVIAAYHHAVAHLEYVDSWKSYVCSGGLLNDDAGDGIPYLLTANHCFSTQTSASSLQAFFDYMTTSCGGAFPSITSFPSSNGSQLLATSTGSDFTLVKLNSVPSGRAFLGYDARTSSLIPGTVLHRISHPFPDTFSQPAPQAYSSRLINTTVGQCTGKERPNFIYSTGGQGGTYGGSSGSPVILAGGYAVGQLFGLCGSDPTAGCDNTEGTVDGALSTTYASIAQYLSPNAAPSVCTPSATTACLLNNRFQVKVRYRGSFDNNPADSDALVKPVTGFASSSYETAFFYFNSPNNIEMVIKMLDQGNVNSAGQATIAVLFGSATPLRIELTITDTQKTAVQKYTSTFGSQKGGTDFTAFVK